MSQHYKRGEKAAPESYEGQLRDLWNEHSANFRPALALMQQRFMEIADQVKIGNKKSELEAFTEIFEISNDYINLSMKSFRTYLRKYVCLYLSNQLKIVDKYKLAYT